MADQNGECFGTHDDDLFHSLGASDSETECLKDFLLEPECISNSTLPSGSNSSVIVNRKSMDPFDALRTGNHVDPAASDDVSSDSQNVFNNCLSEEESVKDDDVFNDLEHDENSFTGIPELSNGNASADKHSLETSGDFSASSVESACAEDRQEEKAEPVSAQIDYDSSNLSQNEQTLPSGSDCDNFSSNSASATPENYDTPVSVSSQNIENGYLEETPVPSKDKGKRGRKRKGTDTLKTRSIGPSKRKRQPITTYQSQISPDQNGIKLKIKMSPGVGVVQRPSKRKERSSRKRRSRKSSTTDEEDSETNSVSETVKKVRAKDLDDSEYLFKEPEVQSDWGSKIPMNVLKRIYQMSMDEESSLPFLFRMGQICHLWRKASVTPSMWEFADFSGEWMKKPYKNTEIFKWLCENRLTAVEDLNMGGWNYLNIQIALDYICRCCTKLSGLNLSGWEGLNADHLRYLITNCPNLARLDLSSINRESNSRGAVSLNSLTYLAQTMGERLTHLVLADNELRGLTQIITAIATHCPNLQLLDLSNVRCHTTASLSIEKLQEGCTKLRVLRMTNSCVTPAPASLREQATAPGFPALEELSVAGPGTDRVTVTYPIMDDNSIERILKSSHKLRLLDVRGCLRITDSSLVRVPAWDLEHLFLSGCCVTRLNGSGLELIVQKWSHSLIEVDLAWSTATEALDLAVSALAERGAESPLRVLNLCGSSVSLAPVKEVLTKCPLLVSLNLSSCRALPRGMKRLYEGEQDITELRNSFDEKQESRREDENDQSQSPCDKEDTQENDKEKRDLEKNSPRQ